MKSTLNPLLRITVFALLGLPLALSAQTPGEVTGLKWCAGSKACLSWDAAPNAASYTLFRGDETTLPGLLTSANDSCRLTNFYSTATGDQLNAVPAAGGLHWYLVVAVNLNGEGAAGPESLNAIGPCDPVTAACPSACYSRSAPPGPRNIPGVGCGCYEGDCAGWGMFCSWRICVENRCVETGALAGDAFHAPEWSR